MMHPKATNTNHYAKAPVAMVAVAASLLVVQAKPADDASTTFTVNVKSDGADSNPGDGQCSVLGSFCSLRATIQESNATPGAINFNILGTAGDGIATISPSSAVPDITDPVTIDGYTQPGASPNTATKGTNAILKVVLSGTDAPPDQRMDGLRIIGGGTQATGRGSGARPHKGGAQ